MSKVPKMISTKDLAYITDMFNWNMIIANKVNLFLEEVTDEEMKIKFSIALDMHIKHANELIALLEGGNK